MKICPRFASVILACVFALGIAPTRVRGQQQAVETLKSVEGEVATSVSHELVREFTLCELRAAWWGRYDVSVRVGKKTTKDGQPRIFQITKGKFSQNADPEATVDLAKVEGRGNVVFASKEEAFARGVPFFISDATLASPTDLNYTVHEPTSSAAPWAHRTRTGSRS
ncbi:MAG: hypothetical protein LAO31_19630 [Acidobacteriia bacterium]|nr:hypothetical protein [Terriglobia bacterium]